MLLSLSRIKLVTERQKFIQRKLLYNIYGQIQHAIFARSVIVWVIYDSRLFIASLFSAFSTIVHVLHHFYAWITWIGYPNSDFSEGQSSKGDHLRIVMPIHVFFRVLKVFEFPWFRELLTNWYSLTLHAKFRALRHFPMKYCGKSWSFEGTSTVLTSLLRFHTRFIGRTVNVAYHSSSQKSCPKNLRSKKENGSGGGRVIKPMY